MIEAFTMMAAMQSQNPSDVPPPDQPIIKPLPATVTWEWMESKIIGDVVVYRIQGLEAKDHNRSMRADLCVLQMNLAKYLAATGGEPTEPPPTDKSFLDWDGHLVSSLGVPAGEGLVVAMELQGNVLLTSPLTTLSCEHLVYSAETGTTDVTEADLRLPAGSGPRGWPLRLMCTTLHEDKYGVLLAISARLTTCDAESPHYSLRLDELVGTPTRNNRYRWKPAGAWLSLSDWKILPLPAPEIDEFGITETAFIGFKGVHLRSGNRLGQSLEIEFGSSGRNEDGSTVWDWTLVPISSSSRGFPTRGEFNLKGDRFSSDWTVFALHDRADDSHPFGRRISRWGENRWLAALNNRLEINDSCRADLDLSFASDPLVDPEFMHDNWLENDDAQSDLFLRGYGHDSVFESSFSIITDRTGYAPLSGYGSDTAAPSFLETLPIVRHTSLPRTVYELSLGERGVVPVNLAYGAELGRLRLRELAPNNATGTASFLASPLLTRDRLRIWGDLDLPIKFGPFALSAGAHWNGLGYSQDIFGNDDAGKSLLETRFELGLLLARDFNDEWRHRVLPQARWRHRSMDGALPANLVQFDSYDAMAAGESVEVSLRQWFLPPGSTQPWLDVDLMLPWYPNPEAPLVDPLFPSARSGSSGSWGPAEVRLSWTPASAGPTLAPLRFDSRLRYDSGQGIEEMFSRLSVRTNDQLVWGASLSKVNDLFSWATAWAEWRVTDSLGFKASLPWRFDELSAARSRFEVRWYAHDFVLEVGVLRDNSVGDNGFYFNILPRFMLESPR